MAGNEPGDRATRPPAPSGAPSERTSGRRLGTAPSARYSDAGGATGGSGGGTPATGATRSALPGPLLRATLVAIAGAAALVVVGAVLASTAGLLFLAGLTGAATGLSLSRAAVPRNEARPIARRRVAWLAIALSIAAVVGSAIATWLVARNEGGTLALIDYLLETFGPFVPAEAVLAALAAAWGANAGPVQS